MGSEIRRAFALTALLLGFVLGAAGCESGNDGDGAISCSSDADCPGGNRCDTGLSICVCATDDACPTGEFCNSFGSCQERTGCAVNEDCADGTFCDVGTGVCLTAPSTPSPQLGSACGLASHCPLGAVCVNGQCERKCFDNGDCVLGQACLDEVCTVAPPGQTICTEADFCEYGDSCEENVCVEDRRGPYCRTCSPRTPTNPNPCEGSRNFCLINSQELGGFTNFCGVDCSEGEGCPSGYSCNNVIVLTQSVCGNTADCRCMEPTTFATGTCSVATPCQPRLPSGEPDPDAAFCIVDSAPSCGGNRCFVPRDQTEGSCTCGQNSDCPGDGTCIEGFCCGGGVRPEEELECRGGEGRVTGFCTCATDDDCGRDGCDPSSGTCRITGFTCEPGNNDCPQIACVNGGCLIGRNCAPEQGLSCSIVSER